MLTRYRDPGDGGYRQAIQDGSLAGIGIEKLPKVELDLGGLF